MALDDVVPTTAADPARFVEATHRTTRWIDRCISAHARHARVGLRGGVGLQLRSGWALQSACAVNGWPRGPA